TIGAAWAIARYAPRVPALADAAHLEQALSPLPVAALRLPEEIFLTLRQVGIEMISQLLVLKRTTLPARFGDVLLQRVEQAIGRVGDRRGGCARCGVRGVLGHAGQPLGHAARPGRAASAVPRARAGPAVPSLARRGGSAPGIRAGASMARPPVDAVRSPRTRA